MRCLCSGRNQFLYLILQPTAIFYVDRSIIGGLVIDVEDKHIDLSVENRIRQIEQVIKEAFGEI
ncbi:hypothetical protein O6H91_Y572500 [Diphasiastrum complanatum]|nr:hypothetical protein O6H91_Y572500 [Diphasiastrum complanatum]